MKNELASSSKPASHAIVIGGSIAGLTAAKVLSNHYDKVTIFERDRMPEGIENRKGVPQGRHPHVILKRGGMIFEELFPGLTDDLRQAGAVEVNVGQSAWYAFGAWRPRYDSTITTTAASRPLLESTARRHLMKQPGLRFVQDCEVVGLEMNASGTHVTGIKVRNRNGAILDTTETTLTADLVVDASGRDSKAPEWLESLGYPVPQETVVDGKAAYATRIFEKNADWDLDWEFMYVQPTAPYQKRGIIFLPMEGGKRWHVTAIGMAGDYPPTDEEGFMEFIRSLPVQMPFEALQKCTPVTPIVGYRRAENRMRHYHAMPRYLENFLVAGDAAIAFNPVYGQGMSSAAIGALVLDACIKEHLAEGQTGSLAERFQKQLEQAITVPWQLATGEDSRWFPVEGATPDPEMMMMGRYMEQVFRATCINPQVLEAFYQVMHMLETPSIFFRPDIVLQVVNEMVTA
ncbi:MAG TPA: FAD-dependent monooxygenase [Chloroflexia bacterium]|nr:FAD-dependent monooxygenase [Chloroflexia bacterium]